MKELLNFNIKYDYDFGSKSEGYKTKGIVKYYVEISDKDELIKLLNIAKKNKLKVIPCGSGSNILINEYFDGLFLFWKDDTIKIINKEKIYDDDTLYLKVGSSVFKEDLINFCIENNLTGLEFWAGIPGRVGGGVSMNSGAYDFEIKELVEQVEFVSEKGVALKDKNSLVFQYRNLEKESYSVITNCVFKLKKALKKDIDDKVNSYLNDRRKKHPLEYPSCGSVFKNPKNKKAWEIIKNLGLSGFKINGAMVSDKHTNFIINKGGASSKDIVNLINYIKDKAKKELSIEMNEEVKII